MNRLLVRKTTAGLVEYLQGTRRWHHPAALVVGHDARAWFR